MERTALQAHSIENPGGEMRRRSREPPRTEEQDPHSQAGSTPEQIETSTQETREGPTPSRHAVEASGAERLPSPDDFEIDIDAVFAAFGKLGAKQWELVIILFILNAYTAFHMIQHVLVGRSVPFTCLSKEDELLENACFDNARNSCTRLEFKLEKGEEPSIVSEWDLVCDLKHQGELAMSVFTAGVLFGTPFLGIVADKLKIGRRPMITFTLLGIIGSTFCSGVIASVNAYVTAKLFSGALCGGCFLSLFVLSSEIVGGSERAFVGTSLQVASALGIALFPMIGKVVQGWRILTKLVSVLGVLLIPLLLRLPESPRWLLAQNREREARKALGEIVTGIEGELPEKRKKDRSKKEEVSFLFKWPLCITTFVQISSWFFNSAALYGLTHSAGKLEGDLYWATALGGTVEVLSFIVANYLLKAWGRKPILVGFMILGGLISLGVQILADYLPSSLPYLPYMVLLCKLCLSASFAVVHIHSSEIFPTSLRSSAMGILSAGATLGEILAPLFLKIGDEKGEVHFYLFGVLSIGAGLSCILLLTETVDRPLPETVTDMSGLSAGGQTPIRPVMEAQGQASSAL